MLFVSFSLWKETTFCIHCSPVAGLSGGMYILLGISGSALPATIHWLNEIRHLRILLDFWFWCVTIGYFYAGLDI